jgi:hypothetical protein
MPDGSASRVLKKRNSMLRRAQLNGNVLINSKQTPFALSLVEGCTEIFEHPASVASQKFI